MNQGVRNSDQIGSDETTERCRWVLQLYVAGQTRRSVVAFSNLARICEERIPGRYDVEVIDVLEHPERIDEHDVVAIPTVVRIAPRPVHKIIGDLSDTERVLAELDIEPE